MQSWYRTFIARVWKKTTWIGLKRKSRNGCLENVFRNRDEIFFYVQHWQVKIGRETILRLLLSRFQVEGAAVTVQRLLVQWF